MIKITNYTMKYDYDCGPTSIAILLSAYGVNYKPDDLIKVLNTDKNDGTSWRRMKHFLEGLKLFKVNEQKSIYAAKKFLEIPAPLLVCWNVDGNSEYSHYSIIIGMNEKSVIILDPEDWEKFTKHDVSEFKKYWQPYRYWSVRLITKKQVSEWNKSGGTKKVMRTGIAQKRGNLDIPKVKNWIMKANKKLIKYHYQ